MFVQVIEGKVKDADQITRQLDRWRKEIRPGAKGYLGSTSGRTSDGRPVSMTKEYVEADKRIVLGFIEPHFMAGFSGGYCTINERTARAGACHFGPHGPAFPAVIGKYPWILAHDCARLMTLRVRGEPGPTRARPVP